MGPCLGDYNPDSKQMTDAERDIAHPVPMPKETNNYADLSPHDKCNDREMDDQNRICDQ